MYAAKNYVSRNSLDTIGELILIDKKKKRLGFAEPANKGAGVRFETG